MSQMINLKKQHSEAPVSEPALPTRKRGLRKIVLLSGAALFLWILWTLFSPSPWRAVFLTNNQVYFGKFTNWPMKDTITLKRIHYLEVEQNLQPQGAGASSEFKIVKLGSEIHGPEDMMVIPKSNILFWENLKKESNLVRAIESAE